MLSNKIFEYFDHDFPLGQRTSDYPDCCGLDIISNFGSYRYDFNYAAEVVYSIFKQASDNCPIVGITFTLNNCHQGPIVKYLTKHNIKYVTSFRNPNTRNIIYVYVLTPKQIVSYMKSLYNNKEFRSTINKLIKANKRY